MCSLASMSTEFSSLVRLDSMMRKVVVAHEDGFVMFAQLISELFDPDSWYLAHADRRLLQVVPRGLAVNCAYRCQPQSIR
jgi:hypothetical protein